MIIKMTGWRTGLQKVSVTNVLQQAGLGLQDAKSCTDRFLAGSVVELPVDGNASADVLRALRKLGVDAELAEDPPNKTMQTDAASPRR